MLVSWCSSCSRRPCVAVHWCWAPPPPAAQVPLHDAGPAACTSTFLSGRMSVKGEPLTHADRVVLTAHRSRSFRLLGPMVRLYCCWGFFVMGLCMLLTAGYFGFQASPPRGLAVPIPVKVSCPNLPGLGERLIAGPWCAITRRADGSRAAWLVESPRYQKVHSTACTTARRVATQSTLSKTQTHMLL